MRLATYSGGFTGGNHETIAELHGLGTLGTKLARHNDLATLSSALHDISDNTVARTANGQATKQLVAQALALGNGAQTAVGDLLGEKLMPRHNE